MRIHEFVILVFHASCQATGSVVPKNPIVVLEHKDASIEMIIGTWLFPELQMGRRNDEM